MFELIRTSWGNIEVGDRVVIPSQYDKPVLWIIQGFRESVNPSGIPSDNHLLYDYDMLCSVDSSEKTITVDIDAWQVQVLRSNR